MIDLSYGSIGHVKCPDCGLVASIDCDHQGIDFRCRCSDKWGENDSEWKFYNINNHTVDKEGNLLNV